LGLSMVYGFAQQSGGFVSIESAVDRGTTVRLYLPRAEGEAPRAEGETPRAEGEAPRARGETVLVIEDALDVRELAVAMLEDLGYSVLAAGDAEAAAKTMAQRSGTEHSGAARSDIDLLLSDVALPGGKSGPDFAEEATRRWPGLRVLFMSGYPAEALARQGRLAEDIPLLSKPFRKVELAHRVREELDRE
ncbi:MAG: response regulator, partial [Proteobacteria bacterium]|nr:response regulator [Pseudomonadota bacterium]